jgi:hypothetical protein
MSMCLKPGYRSSQSSGPILESSESKNHCPLGVFAQTRVPSQLARIKGLCGGSWCFQKGDEYSNGTRESLSAVSGRSVTVVIYWKLGKASLKAVELGNLPMGSNPGVGNEVRGF